MDEILDEDDAAEVDPLWAQLQTNGEIEEGVLLDDFLYADQALATTGTRTLEEIVELVQEQQESEDEAIEANVQQQSPVSRQDAYKGFDQLRRYVEENNFDSKFTQMCNQFEDLLHQEQMKNMIQAPITQFLPPKKSDQSSITQFFN